MAMTVKQLYQLRRAYLDKYVPYKLKYWEDFNYKCLSNIMYKKKTGRGENTTYNDVIIMADTETSKKPEKEIYYDPTYWEVQKYVKTVKIKNTVNYKEVATYRELKKVGINISKVGIISVDGLYEELTSLYPWLFNEEFNDIDCLANIYNYLREEPEIPEKSLDNHVVAWTISIRAFERNIVTLWGRKPSDFVECLDKIVNAMPGFETFIYFHNLSYDWVFLRKFMFAKYDYPAKQLNTKSHYPIYIKWNYGITFKDSLILAQRNLEKWAEDLDVEHKKAVGCWDYDKLRNQDEEFTEEELTYIEHDTLAGVECINKLMNALNKSIFSMPYTATGIPREDIRNLGKLHGARDLFKRIVPDFHIYCILEECFHGGFTHANRYYIDETINQLVEAQDEASAYPYVVLSEKFPMERFTLLANCSIDYILKYANEYAFIAKYTFINVRLKDYKNPMPTLQFSKAVNIINSVCDNGRILCADYVEIYLTEMDLQVILEAYDYDNHIVTDVHASKKDYLPRWFTDYIFQLFVDKTMLKGKDKVLYALAKAKLNAASFGMLAQKNVKDSITENYDTGEYDQEEKDPKEIYDAYIKKPNTILPYQWGVYITAYSFYNLHQIGKCAGTWLYSDTDSCYGLDWNHEALNEYNESCKSKLIANGYGAVEHNGREYWLGVTELDGTYSQYRVLGAKRYCGRSTEDGELHITVAGVPKRGVKCLNNDINNFQKGFIFRGADTGKLTHIYNYIEEIYIDEYGNETGDSIDLSSCDYKLDSIPVDWEYLDREEIEIQVYDESDLT